MGYHFWIGTIGIVLYIVSMYTAGVMQGLMWRFFDESGKLSYDFTETVTAIIPPYWIRAVAGLPLGPAEQVKPAVMVNLLGEHMEMFRSHFPRLPGDIKPHWYGKKEAKPGRKMGHLTLLGRSMEEAVQWMDGSGIWPPLTEQEKKVIYNRDS